MCPARARLASQTPDGIDRGSQLRNVCRLGSCYGRAGWIVRDARDCRISREVQPRSQYDIAVIRSAIVRSISRADSIEMALPVLAPLSVVLVLVGVASKS